MSTTTYQEGEFVYMNSPGEDSNIILSKYPRRLVETV